MGVDDGGPDGFEDYYDLLGVEETASRETIMAAYREQVQRYHPDVADREGDAVAVAERMKELSRARETLANPANREAYDRLGHGAYVTRQRGGETLTPTAEGSSRPSTTGATGTSAGETDRSADVTAPTPGTVVEGDPETTLSDLVEEDPLTVAWRWFRRCWGLRLFMAVAVGGVVLGQSGDTVGLTGWLTVVLIAVAVTGGYAQSRVPTAEESATPPPGSPVGFLRPSVARTVRVRARRLLIVALVLTVTAPPPWHVFDPTRGGTWSSVSSLNTLLSTLLVLTVVGGLLATLVGVSATVWLSAHSDPGRWGATLWDLGLTAVAGFSLAAFLATTTPLALHSPLTDATLTATGLCLTLGVVVLAGWRHGRPQETESTSAATS